MSEYKGQPLPVTDATLYRRMFTDAQAHADALAAVLGHYVTPDGMCRPCMGTGKDWRAALCGYCTGKGRWELPGVEG
jgi:hypothetical protein